MNLPYGTIRAGLTLVVALLIVSATNADRAPVDRDTAKFVVEGVVESVEKSADGEHDWFLVRIKLTKVEKGDGIKVGDVFKATCYALVRPKPKTFASAGHDGVPAKGDRIKAFVSNHETHGGFEGVYPSWFDKLEAKK
jgi:hypothetical protein